MNTIILERAYTDIATIGKMRFPSGLVLDTIELPWKDNEQMVSCIPPGQYVMSKRQSGVVNRTSKGKYTIGWEVTKVQNRTFIMVHIGNTASNFEGCIGVGLGLGVVNGTWAILNSAKAFDLFMDEMTKHEDWNIIIRTRTVE
jgi:pantothenate kinase